MANATAVTPAVCATLIWNACGPCNRVDFVAFRSAAAPEPDVWNSRSPTAATFGPSCGSPGCR